MNKKLLTTLACISSAAFMLAYDNTNERRGPVRTVAEGTGRAVEGTGRAAGNIVEGTGEFAGNVVKDTGGFLGGIFGGRERREERRQRREERRQQRAAEQEAEYSEPETVTGVRNLGRINQ